MSIFEAIMLICFGSAWPFSIYRSYTSRKNAGKSIAFLGIIFVGYVSGSTHKLLYNHDAVTYLYLLNGVLVFTDIMIYWRNHWLAGRIRLAPWPRQPEDET